MTAYTVVLPTVGRPSLGVVLGDLLDQPGPPPAQVLLVDDRPLDQREPLELPPGTDVRVLRSGGRGPAAARNTGWRSATTEWVAFLDDDVRLPGDWATRLVADLTAAGPDVGGVQGRIVVPLPTDRRPTDWERNTAGLATARWATADMVYRRAALAQVHGFDERFPRAYREDADLALRVVQAGWQLRRGEREIVHPVRPADDAVSLRTQAGGGSDALMRALHGPAWRRGAGTGRGRFRWHVATVAAGAGAVALGLTTIGQGPAASGRRRAAAIAATTWAALTADFTARRIVPGPRPGEGGWAAEWRRMAWTSVAIPVAAVWHRLRGALRFRDVPPWQPPVRAVLLDRDGTLVVDVPYNGDPEQVTPVAGAERAVRRLRRAGLHVGLVTNQSGVARGLLTEDDVARVNDRLQELVGRFDVVEHCPHGPGDGCTCRKPAAQLVLRAAAALGVAPHECLVVGDIGSDVDAARAAGARAVLVPTPVTRREEIEQAEHVAGDLAEAVDHALALTGVRP